jgi:hypothetical protein
VRFLMRCLGRSRAEAERGLRRADILGRRLARMITAGELTTMAEVEAELERGLRVAPGFLSGKPSGGKR